MKISNTVLAAMVALSSSCGGSYCDRYKAATDKFFGAKTECKSANAAGSIAVSKASLTCKADVSKCSADDLKVLDAFVSCVNSASPCTDGKEDAAISAFLACGLAANGKVSQACVDSQK
jgi:hypothetical protein